MICAEVAIYPLKTADASSIVNQSIASLQGRGVDYTVGSISTHLHGTEEQVWASLHEMFRQARRGGEVSMVVTVTNAADS